jgi:hypothetical protein
MFQFPASGGRTANYSNRSGERSGEFDEGTRVSSIAKPSSPAGTFRGSLSCKGTPTAPR